MPGWWTLINCVCSVDLEKVCWKHFSEWGEVEVKTSGGFYLRWDTCGGPQCIHATLTFALSSAPDSDSPTHSHAHSNGTHSCVLPGYVVFTRPFGVGFRDATLSQFCVVCSTSTSCIACPSRSCATDCERPPSSPSLPCKTRLKLTRDKAE